jgi:hypothetical protein
VVVKSETKKRKEEREAREATKAIKAKEAKKASVGWWIPEREREREGKAMNWWWRGAQ